MIPKWEFTFGHEYLSVRGGVLDSRVELNMCACVCYAM